MKRKHIVMFTIDFFPNNFGGIGIHVYNIAQLLKDNYDVTIVLSNYKDEDFNETKIDRTKGFEVIHIPVPHSEVQKKYGDADENFTLMVGVGYSFYMAEQAEKYIDFSKGNVILHNHCCLFSIACEYLKDKYELPLVSTLHFTLWDQKRTLDKTLMNSMMSASDKCIFVSKWLMEDLNKLENKWADKEIVIHNGVDTTPTFNNECDGMLKICIVGSLIYRKGVDILLNAVSVMENKGDVVIDIIGEGNEEKALKQLVQKLKLNANFYGKITQEEVYHKIRECNIVAMPSREEPFALVALETFALGRCLVASNTGGFVELIDDGHTGLLFEMNNYIDMAKKLNLLYEDKELLFDISSNALQESKKYTWSNIINKLTRVYEEVT